MLQSTTKEDILFVVPEAQKLCGTILYICLYIFWIIMIVEESLTCGKKEYYNASRTKKLHLRFAEEMFSAKTFLFF